MKSGDTRLFLPILFAALVLQPQIQAQCDRAQPLEDHKPEIYYKEHTERGMLNDVEWNEIAELGRTFGLEHASPAGFLESGFIKRWKLVDVTDLTQRENFRYALIAAVNESRKDSHAFFAQYRFIKKRDLIDGRIRKADLTFYSRMVHAEGVSIDTPSLALDVCLLFLQASTHQARGLFIQMISTVSDIPQPSDKTRRFWGIVREQTDSSSLAEYRNEIDKLSKTLSSPRYSKSGAKYDLSFFTWDPYSGDVEYWCVTISSSGISGITRKLVSHRV
jgi:hypothetical protein